MRADTVEFWDASVSVDGTPMSRRKAANFLEATTGVPVTETLAAFLAGSVAFAGGKWEASTYKGGPNKGQPCERHSVSGKARAPQGEEGAGVKADAVPPPVPPPAPSPSPADRDIFPVGITPPVTTLPPGVGAGGSAVGSDDEHWLRQAAEARERAAERQRQWEQAHPIDGAGAPVAVTPSPVPPAPDVKPGKAKKDRVVVTDVLTPPPYKQFGKIRQHTTELQLQAEIRPNESIRIFGMAPKYETAGFEAFAKAYGGWRKPSPEEAWLRSLPREKRMELGGLLRERAKNEESGTPDRQLTGVISDWLEDHGGSQLWLYDTFGASPVTEKVMRPVDRTFKVGDTVIVGGYNFDYYGTISSITPKTVVAEEDYGDKKKVFSIWKFVNSHHDLDLEQSYERRRNWSD